MGIVMNKETNSCGFFDSFGRNFSWLEDTLKKHFNFAHKTRHVIQSTSSSTCGLHTLYFIIKMVDPMNKSNCAKNVNVGEYVRIHYNTKEENPILKGKDIVEHLSKKCHTNFSMLLKSL